MRENFVGMKLEFFVFLLYNWFGILGFDDGVVLEFESNRGIYSFVGRGYGSGGMFEYIDG